MKKELTEEELSKERQIMVESIFETIDFSKSYKKTSPFFKIKLYDFFT